MAVRRAERFEERKPRVIAVFGDDEATLHMVSQVLELMELAWHDCYEESTPPDEVIDNLLLCPGGTLHAAHLAVIDSRDLAVWASETRSRTGG
jgi:hypothetical protein